NAETRMHLCRRSVSAPEQARASGRVDPDPDRVCTLSRLGFSWSAARCQSQLARQAASNINPPRRKVGGRLRWRETLRLQLRSQLGDVEGIGSRVSKEQIILAGLQPNRRAGRRLQWSLHTLALSQLTLGLSSWRAVPLFLLVARAKYPELRLVAQQFLDKGEAVCLQLPGGAAQVKDRFLSPKPGLELQGRSTAPLPRALSQSFELQSPFDGGSSIQELDSPSIEGTHGLYEIDPPRPFPLARVQSTPQRENMAFIFTQTTKFI
ncbi:hypothetical protein H1C71_002349, partial [Ictidomys tridecemlineatus]